MFDARQLGQNTHLGKMEASFDQNERAIGGKIGEIGNTPRSRSAAVEAIEQMGGCEMRNAWYRTNIVFKGIVKFIDPVKYALKGDHGSYVVYENC